MTCWRPTKKAYFQDNVKLNAFMHETYPAIVKEAKQEDAVIYRGGVMKPELTTGHTMPQDLRQKGNPRLPHPFQKLKR